MTVEGKPAPQNAFVLEQEAPKRLAALRGAVSAVIGEIDGGTARATDLANTLGLPTSLAWKVWKVARGPERYPSIKHIPGKVARERFLEAAQSVGASRARVQAARDAFESFEEMARRHAPNKDAIETLLSTFTSEGKRRHELDMRREAYRSFGYFLGASMAGSYGASIMTPGPSPKDRTINWVRGIYGLVRTKPNTPFVLGAQRITPEEETPSQELERSPLIPAKKFPGSVGILPAFSTDPLPEFTRYHTEQGVTVDELAAGPIGNAGAVDLVAAERVIALNDEPRTSPLTITSFVRAPSEQYCFDLFLHEDYAQRADPKIEFSSVVNSLGLDANTRHDPLDLGETLVELGTADVASPSAIVPRHAELLDFVFGRAKIDPAHYRLYRLEMRYPLVASQLRVHTGIL